MSTQVFQSLFKQYQTSATGLTEPEVAKKLAQIGPNEIVAKRKKPLILEFFEEFKDLMVILLIMAAVISGVAGEYKDAAVIMFIVLLNATIGFIQKYRAEKAVEALKKMIAPKARVLRNNQEKLIDAKELVPGDIIILSEGDCITADAILLEENEIRIQEATLTGESIPVAKDPYSQNNQKKDPISSSLFMGTIVTNGNGKALVCATGMRTKFGKIADLTQTTKKDKSPLEKELTRIGVLVSKITLVISGILLLYGYYIEKRAFLETFLFAASVAVAAVPEGLPATVTIALAIGVQRLAKKNAIVKQLASVETLGSTTVICTDKTGTLTKNEMTAKEMFSGNYNIQITGSGYEEKGELLISGNKEFVFLSKEHFIPKEKNTKFLTEMFKESKPEIYHIIEMITLAGTVCNNAKLVKNEASKWTCLGDPTEGALLTLNKKAGFDIDEINQKHPRIYELPFTSERKMMTTINSSPEKKIYAFSKGAPDELIKKCTHYLNQKGQIEKIDSEYLNKILEINSQMAQKALRVIGLGFKELDHATPRKKYHHQEVENNFIFLGLIGIIDPPREEVKDAVTLSKKAGIKVYVITGDHGLTASAIAKQLGIVTTDNPKIVTGEELESLSEKQLLDVFNAHEEVIFARVSPEHKLKIVSALKNRGEVVAVTGDGVNDAPALKRADIGVSMGITGTDVSKEASNIVLADDSFATIVNAIQEGRTIYQNLKKFIYYIFSCNVGELCTVFAALFLVLPPPLTALLILCVDLGTDVFPALAIGVDPPEPKIMEQKPRDPKAQIMNGSFIKRYLIVGLFIGAVVVGSYIYTLYKYGWEWGGDLKIDDLSYLKASTTAFALLVLIQMINAFNARSEKNSLFRLGIFSNRWLFAAISLSILVLILMVEVPFIQDLIHTTHLNGNEWLFIMAMSLSVFVFEETRKKFAS